MKNLLEFIVSEVVEKPEEVKIEQSTQDEMEILNLTVAPDDMGKIIGKNGQIIKAIRTLLRTAAFQKGTKVQIFLQDSSIQN